MRLDMARIKRLRVRQEMEIKRYKSLIGIGIGIEIYLHVCRIEQEIDRGNIGKKTFPDPKIMKNRLL